MCDYQRGTIECRGDGYCWDADYDGYDPQDHSMPCPACNTKGWLEQRKEEAESCSHFSGTYGSGTGVDIWESAVATAYRENPEGTDALLREIGAVEALYEDAQGGVLTKHFTYPAQVESNLAKITVRPDGFVDGACYGDDPDNAAWLKEMERAGQKVFEVPRDEARALWGEFLPLDHPIRQQLPAAA